MNIYECQQTGVSKPSQKKRLLGATIAAVLVAWWGIHFNAVFQVIRAANETQLENPTGAYSHLETYMGAAISGIEAYAIGIVIILCTACVVWPVLAFVPRKSSFWRLPVLMILGVSLPLAVVACEAWIGSTRSTDKWSDVGANHLFVDMAGYLTLGLTYGFAVWFTFKTYISQEWRLLAWAGLGFSSVAVPASLLLIQRGSTSVPVLGDAAWPILETLLCIVGAFVAGLGWLAHRMAGTRSVRAG
jgi:hypothetical protein